MLIVADNLTSYALGAGEPFLLQIAFQISSGAPADISGRAFVLSFYKSDRSLVTQLAGVPDADADGSFLRFEKDGTFSETLVGASNIKIELAERLLDGRNVIATGTLTVAATALTVPSLATGQIGLFASRIAIKASQTLGAPPAFSQHAVAFAPYVPPAVDGAIDYSTPGNPL